MFVGMGNNDDLVAPGHERLSKHVDVALDSANLREEEVADHSSH